jgi:hypothetical protein
MTKLLQLKRHDGTSYKKQELYIEGATQPSEKEEKALAILLGAYNAHGRPIMLKEYQELQSEFAAIIRKTARLL